MKDGDYPGKPKERKREAEDDDESDSSGDSGRRELKKYKVSDIPELEDKEVRAKTELARIQHRLAVLKRHQAAKGT